MTSAARKPIEPADEHPELADDPVWQAFQRAPMGEPDPPEMQAEIERAMADVRAGRVVPHEEVMTWLKATKPEGEDWPDGDEEWPDGE